MTAEDLAVVEAAAAAEVPVDPEAVEATGAAMDPVIDAERHRDRVSEIQGNRGEETHCQRPQSPLRSR